MEDTEEEIVIEDLPIDQLIIDTDKKEDGTIARVDKVILVGYPHSELHVEKLKEYGFGFDRLLYMTCKDEENPGKEVVKRNTHPDSLQYVWEVEDEAGKKQLTFAQEIMTTEEKPGAEQVTEIDCNGTPDEVFNKIRRAIDPFCLQPDKEEDIIVSADLQEDDDGNKPRLPRSDFGDYCPVTFVDEGFMIKGDPEQEE